MPTWSFYLSKKPQVTRKVWQADPHTPTPENKVQTLDKKNRKHWTHFRSKKNGTVLEDLNLMLEGSDIF
jgi:hypothetical protein